MMMIIPSPVFGQINNYITVPFQYSEHNTIPSSYQDQISQKYQDSLWRIGKNLSENDSYHYKICNDKSMFQEIYPYHCYDIELTFLKVLESYKDRSWVVQGHLGIGDKTTSMILLINENTFEVTSDKLNIQLARSLENTIFSLSQYGDSSLTVGTQWDQLDSYFTNKVPLEIKRHEIVDSEIGIIDTVLLGYDMVVPSNYFISEDFAFPVRALLYSPHIIFPEPVPLFHYELVGYSVSDGVQQLSTMCVGVSQEMVNNYADDSENVIDDGVAPPFYEDDVTINGTKSVVISNGTDFGWDDLEDFE